MGKTRKYDTGRNTELAKALRGRPSGYIDPRPRKQRTRGDDRRQAIINSMKGQ